MLKNWLKEAAILKARISVKGQDEIALACGYINQFIEKTHKAVSSASHNLKNSI